MDNLPNELLSMIFRSLNLTDLNNCKLISKRFKDLCDNLKVEELIIAGRREEYKHWWFYTNKPLNYEDSVSLKTFTAFKSDYKLEQNLKRLHIRYGPSQRFHFRCLDGFNRLEQLDVDSISYDSVYCFQAINLINLRILRLRYIQDQVKEARLHLKTPKLKILWCSNLNLIRVADPLTVVRLETTTYVSKIKRFKNLEFLQVNYVRDLDLDVLSYFGKLKQLHLITDPAIFGQNFHEKKLNTTIDYILKQKLLLGSDVRIFFHGVEMVDRQLRQIGMSRSRLDFMLRNYHHLADNLYFVVDVDLTELLMLTFAPSVGNCCHIPVDFFHKFYNIQAVFTNSTRLNETVLIWFLKQIKNLRILNFFNANFNQSFYDVHIPGYRQLTTLAIICELNEPNINFDFILRIKQLTYLRTNLQFNNSFELAVRSFNEKRNLTEVEFRKKGDLVKISRNQSNQKYNLFCNKLENGLPGPLTYARRNIDREQLVTHCNELRLLDMFSEMKLQFSDCSN